MSVAFVREESAEAAQEGGTASAVYHRLVTQSGLQALEQTSPTAELALEAAQAVEDANRAPPRSGAGCAGCALFRGTRRQPRSAA